ncbi:MFS transporter [Oceanobacillus kapialis]|uniref:MFS transporter n=1 Tax=Oceanobacillus kapialis TaxID=481353 RepID=A0ABW5PW19_9BACI
MILSRKKYAAMTAILFLCALTVVSSVYTMTPLTEPLMQSLKINHTQAAGAASVFSFFYAVGFLVFGPIGSRFGNRRTMLTGLLTLGIITLAGGLVMDYSTLLLLRAFQGFFAASFAPNALTYVFQTYPDRQRITAISYISFGYVTAGIFGQVMATILDYYYKWQAIFLVFGILYIFIFLMMTWGLPKERKQASTIYKQQYWKSVIMLLKVKQLMYCYVITSVLLLAFIGMYTILGGSLQAAPYYITDIELLFIRSVGFIGMLLSLCSGYFVEKFGAIRTLRGSLAISIGGLCGVGLLSNPLMITVMSILFVAGISLTFPVMMLLVGEWGGAERAAASSFYAFILFVGATIGPMIAVPLYQAFGFMVSCCLLAAILGFGSIFSLFIREKKKTLTRD